MAQSASPFGRGSCQSVPRSWHLVVDALAVRVLRRSGLASFGSCVVRALRGLGPAPSGSCVVRALRRLGRALSLDPTRTSCLFPAPCGSSAHDDHSLSIPRRRVRMRGPSARAHPAAVHARAGPRRAVRQRPGRCSSWEFRRLDREPARRPQRLDHDRAIMGAASGHAVPGR